MKKSKRITLVILTAALILIAGISAFAVADEPSSEKEEVVYAKTDANGDVRGVYVVNIFSGGDIVDYGDYSDVEVLNTTDEISQNGDKITVSTDAESLYYEGTMESRDLPWDIDIRYTLDGERITPEELAGKSGELEINLGFHQNISCDSSFFDRYALQTTLSLDTEKCENIVANGATIANVGQNKQLSYILLPGKEKEYTITADVTDFEMESISINGIRMDLSIDIDNEELMDQVRQIEDAAVALDDGAAAVNSGAEQLAAGTNELNESTVLIAGGGATLAAGIQSFTAGLEEAQTGLELLNSESKNLTSGSKEVKTALNTIDKKLSELSVSAEEVEKLVNASSQINQSLKELSGSLSMLEQSTGTGALARNGIDLNALKGANGNAIATVESDIDTLRSILRELSDLKSAIRGAGYGNTYDSYVSQINGLIADLQSVKGTLGTDNTALGGTEQYLTTLHQQTAAIQSGAADLSAQYEKFNEEIVKLASTLTTMINDMGELSEAISILSSRYDTLDAGIQAYTEGVAALVAGFDQSAEAITLLTTGSQELAVYLNALCGGTDDLNGGALALADGTDELNAGTAAFRAATTDMDAKVQTEIDNMISSLTGGNGKTKSFVSDKNTKVTAVQFVISTDPVEVKDEE
ncbi:MAG: hypothetical protein ACI3W6_08440 [Clostridia bacterium]